MLLSGENTRAGHSRRSNSWETLPYKWLTVPASKASALETDTEKFQIPRVARFQTISSPILAPTKIQSWGNLVHPRFPFWRPSEILPRTVRRRALRRIRTGIRLGRSFAPKNSMPRKPQLLRNDKIGNVETNPGICHIGDVQLPCRVDHSTNIRDISS